MSVTSRIPVAKFGWIVVAVVVAAPFLFFALVAPKEKEKAEPPKIELPPSKLVAVGLRENRDWDGLPEIFSLWESRLQWRDGKARFAFWHPIEKRYSYFFEVVRTHTGFRFKEVDPTDAEREFIDGVFGDENGQEDQFTPEEHPLFFLGNRVVMEPRPMRYSPPAPQKEREQQRVKLDVPPSRPASKPTSP